MTAPADPAERQLAAQALATEYGVLMAAVGAAWSASLVRTSLFLAVLSAAGVALGFAAQAGTTGATFHTFALVTLPLVLFLGVATFVRLVEVQRELVVYLTGMNRIRRFFMDAAPSARPFYVLPGQDDAVSLARSIGTGMRRRPPNRQFPELVVQTQGIVGVVTGVVAGALAGLGVAAIGVGELTSWAVAVVAFLATIAVLFAWWRRSLAEIQSSIHPRFPTKPEEIGAPF